MDTRLQLSLDDTRMNTRILRVVGALALASFMATIGLVITLL